MKTILEKYKKEFETIGTIIYQEEAKGILSKALDEQRTKQKNKVIKLKQEFANTPIEERRTGWDWLNRIEKEL